MFASMSFLCKSVVLFCWTPITIGQGVRKVGNWGGPYSYIRVHKPWNNQFQKKLMRQNLNTYIDMAPLNYWSSPDRTFVFSEFIKSEFAQHHFDISRRWKSPINYHHNPMICNFTNWDSFTYTWIYKLEWSQNGTLWYTHNECKSLQKIPFVETKSFRTKLPITHTCFTYLDFIISKPRDQTLWACARELNNDTWLQPCTNRKMLFKGIKIKMWL